MKNKNLIILLFCCVFTTSNLTLIAQGLIDYEQDTIKNFDQYFKYKDAVPTHLINGGDSILSNVIHYLKSNPQAKLIILTENCMYGDPFYSVPLRERRVINLRNYLIYKIKIPDHQVQIYFLPETASYSPIHLCIGKIQPEIQNTTEEGLQVENYPLEFNFNRSDLKEKGEAQIKALAQFLIQNPDYQLELEFHIPPLPPLYSSCLFTRRFTRVEEYINKHHPSLKKRFQLVSTQYEEEIKFRVSLSILSVH